MWGLANMFQEIAPASFPSTAKACLLLCSFIKVLLRHSTSVPDARSDHIFIHRLVLRGAGSMQHAPKLAQSRPAVAVHRPGNNFGVTGTVPACAARPLLQSRVHVRGLLSRTQAKGKSDTPGIVQGEECHAAIHSQLKIIQYVFGNTYYCCTIIN